MREEIEKIIRDHFYSEAYNCDEKAVNAIMELHQEKLSQQKAEILSKFKKEVQKIDVEGWEWDRGEAEINDIIKSLEEE